MELYQRIESDMKASLKSGDAARLSVIRMIIAAVKTFQIDKNVKVPQESDILQILQKQIKQRRESIEQFRNGNRQDLADKEAAELKILEAYMPEQMSEADLETLVKAAIAETGATAKADTGKVMKAVMERAKGRCDGKLVNQAVMKFLK